MCTVQRFGKTSMAIVSLLLSCAVILVVGASDVLEFTDKNFATEVADHDIILVEFFAPW